MIPLPPEEEHALGVLVETGRLDHRGGAFLTTRPERPAAIAARVVKALRDKSLARVRQRRPGGAVWAEPTPVGIKKHDRRREE